LLVFCSWFQSIVSWSHCFWIRSTVEHYSREVHGAKLLTLWWPETEREGARVPNPLQGHAPRDLSLLYTSLNFLKVPPPPSSATDWTQAYNTWSVRGIQDADWNSQHSPLLNLNVFLSISLPIQLSIYQNMGSGKVKQIKWNPNYFCFTW
jgi:hypothetical protein